MFTIIIIALIQVLNRLRVLLAKTINDHFPDKNESCDENTIPKTRNSKLKCTGFNFTTTNHLVGFVSFVHKNVRIVRRMVLNCARKLLQVFAETLTMLWNFAYKQQHPPSPIPHTGTQNGKKRPKRATNSRMTMLRHGMWCVLLLSLAFNM